MERPVTLNGLTGRAAGFAPLGGLEVPLRIELLFPVGERERRAAVAAGKLLISHTVREKEDKVLVSFSSIVGLRR